MQLDIPFFSQLDDVVPKELQRSVCAIACLKMIFDFKNIENTFINLFTEGEIVGGRSAAGWNHEVIVRVLRNHGILAYRQEFLAHAIDLETQAGSIADHSESFAHSGLKKIKQTISQGLPVIISVTAGFSQDHSGKRSLNMANHIVLVTGYDDENLYVHDPIFTDGKAIKISNEHFFTYWRKFAIFVE